MLNSFSVSSIEKNMKLCIKIIQNKEKNQLIYNILRNHARNLYKNINKRNKNLKRLKKENK
jgi:hypothetical protein